MPEGFCGAREKSSEIGDSSKVWMQRRNNFPAGGSPTSKMAQADGIICGRYSAASRIATMSHRMRALLRAVQLSIDVASEEFDEMLDHYLSRITLSLFVSCLISMKG